MSLGLCGTRKLRKKLTVQMLDSTQASEPPQLPVFKIKQNKTKQNHHHHHPQLIYFRVGGRKQISQVSQAT